MRDNSLNELALLSNKVFEEVQNSLLIKTRPVSTIRSLFSSSGRDTHLRRQDSLPDLAAKGDLAARSTLLDLIITTLSTTVRVKAKSIDSILSGYYINFYGGPEDITSYRNPLLDKFLSKFLISRDADYEVKVQKLAQILYEECFGYGIIDIFRDLGVDKEKYDKVEEVQINGPRQIGVKISGLNFKLDRLVYPPKEIQKICQRLSRNSSAGLTESNPVVETELLDQTRINLNCPPFSGSFSINYRLHYGHNITREDCIRIGSSTEEYEKFLDLLCIFKSRLIFFGGQGVGKTTDIINYAKRYPKNCTVTTVESSFELELDKIRSLLVNKVRTGILSADDLLSKLFRYNAQALIYGEARSPEDVMLACQTSKRQDYGALTTWHAATAYEGIVGMADALVRGGYYKTQRGALQEVTTAFDFAIVKRVADKMTSKPGLRHIYQVVEIPRITQENDVKLEPRVLFEYDYDKMTLVKKNNLSEDKLNVLAKRTFAPGYMEVLKSGNY